LGNKQKDHLGDTGIDGKKILKCALEEEYLRVRFELIQDMVKLLSSCEHDHAL
jgi:hypothetical protein